MGQDRVNVKARTHGQSAGAVVADREILFHWADKSISEALNGTQLGSAWKDLADAVRTSNSTAFDNAIDDLKALVSFAWDDDPDDWSDAVFNAFDDMIHPS